jgi:hypothetical protein
LPGLVEFDVDDSVTAEERTVAHVDYSGGLGDESRYHRVDLR